MLCLHLLQVSLVYVNTLMMQQVPAEWQGREMVWPVMSPLGVTCRDCSAEPQLHASA